MENYSIAQEKCQLFIAFKYKRNASCDEYSTFLVFCLRAWYPAKGATDKRQAVGSPEQIGGASLPLDLNERGADNGYIFRSDSDGYSSRCHYCPVFAGK